MGRRWTAGDDPAGDGPAGHDPAADAPGGDWPAGQRPGGGQALSDQGLSDQASRVWAAMRALVEAHPTKQRLRDALDLGRGSGRVKSLMWLTEGPLSLSGLAEAIGVDAPYATLIVDSLEERGLVERQPDPADRRRKLVTLTPAGQDAVAEVLRIQLEPPPGFGRLSAAELDLLEKLVWRITAGSD